MNLILDIRNLTDRETFDGMIAALGGGALDEHTTAQRTARLDLERGLAEETRPVFLTYSDALTDGAGVREEAAARAGLLLGVGIGVGAAAAARERGCADRGCGRGRGAFVRSSILAR